MLSVSLNKTLPSCYDYVTWHPGWSLVAGRPPDVHLHGRCHLGVALDPRAAVGSPQGVHRGPHHSQRHQLHGDRNGRPLGRGAGLGQPEELGAVLRHGDQDVLLQRNGGCGEADLTGGHPLVRHGKQVLQRRERSRKEGNVLFNECTQRFFFFLRFIW